MAPKKERKQTAANGKGTGSKKAGTAAAPARGRKAAPKRKQAGAKAAQPGAERPSKKAKSVEAGAAQPGPGYLLTAVQESQAEQLIREAKSALQFHDPRTTVLRLQEALALLTQLIQ